MTAPENTRERVAEALIDWWEHESGEEVRAVEATTEVAGQYADALLPLIDTLLREQAEGIAAAIHAAKPPHFTRDYRPVDAAYDSAARIARTFGGER